MQHPVDTTVCQGDNAEFTCVIYVPSGGLVIPAWLRNGTNVNKTRHTVVGNMTNNIAPAYVSSTVIVSNVTVLDDGTQYRCDILSLITSRNALLKVVGEYMPCL